MLRACLQVVCTGPLDIAQARSPLTNEEVSTIDLFRRNTPSVVYITNLASRRDQFTLNMLETPQASCLAKGIGHHTSTQRVSSSICYHGVLTGRLRDATLN